MVDRLTYTISEAAREIGIGRTMLYKLINEGGLRTVRLGKRVLIPRDSILELLGMQPAADLAARTPDPMSSEERTYIVTIRPVSMHKQSGAAGSYSLESHDRSSR